MTKAELVEEVARAAELNKRDAEVIVETVFESIITALQKGEKVELRGFGSFRTRERGPRRGRNPKTGEPVDVPAKRVPYFKPGKELKEFFTDAPEAGDAGTGPVGSQEAAGSTSGAEPAPEPHTEGGVSSSGFGSSGGAESSGGSETTTGATAEATSGSTTGKTD